MAFAGKNGAKKRTHSKHGRGRRFPGFERDFAFGGSSKASSLVGKLPDDEADRLRRSCLILRRHGFGAESLASNPGLRQALGDGLRSLLGKATIGLGVSLRARLADDAKVKFREGFEFSRSFRQIPLARQANFVGAASEDNGTNLQLADGTQLSPLRFAEGRGFRRDSHGFFQFGAKIGDEVDVFGGVEAFVLQFRQYLLVE